MLRPATARRVFVCVGLLFATSSCKTASSGSSAVKDDEAAAGQPTPAQTSWPLELGEKAFVGSDGADEAAWVQKLVGKSDQTVAGLKQSTGLARRSAHSKTHGCVTGTFAMDPNRPEEAKVGLFAQDGEFPTWIRFSNAFPKMQSDITPDGRGMAVKVIDLDGKVQGQKLLPGHESSNAFDYPFVSGPIFPTRNIEDYYGLEDNAGKFFLSHKREALLAGEVASQVMSSPLNGYYWSMGAYKLGGKAVKYSTRPSKACPGTAPMRGLDDLFSFISNAKSAVTSLSTDLGANYLRNAMTTQLNPNGGHAVCFDFGVQFQADAAQMPVEDPSVEWRESASLFSKASGVLTGHHAAVAPFVKLATITIPQQEFASNDGFCERLSFNPWRTVAEQRPLGNLMRARLQVYAASLKERTRLNQVDPVGDDLTGTQADASK